MSAKNETGGVNGWPNAFNGYLNTFDGRLFDIDGWLSSFDWRDLTVDYHV